MRIMKAWAATHRDSLALTCFFPTFPIPPRRGSKKALTKPKEGVNRIFSMRTKFNTGATSRLQCLAVSPNEESIVITTRDAELLHLPFDDLSFWGDHVGGLSLPRRPPAHMCCCNACK